MTDNELIRFLSNLTNAKSGDYNQSSKTFKIDDVKIPSPIQLKITNINNNIIQEVIKHYTNLISSKSIKFERPKEFNTEYNLHSIQDDYKDFIKHNLSALNSDFDLLNKSVEEQLLLKESVTFEESKILSDLEAVWEYDVSNLSLKELVMKWNIQVPNYIRINDEIITFKGFGETSNLFYITSTKDILEIYI